MSEQLSKIRAELAFYEEVLPLEEELEAAREDKANDPVRFQVAKQAFEEKRAYWRHVGEALKGIDPDNPIDSIPKLSDVVESDGTVIGDADDTKVEVKG